MGIPLPKMQYSSESEAEDAGKRGKLIEMHERACKFFEDQLAAARRSAGARIPGGSRAEGRDDPDVQNRVCAGFRLHAERPA